VPEKSLVIYIVKLHEQFTTKKVQIAKKNLGQYKHQKYDKNLPTVQA